MSVWIKVTTQLPPAKVGGNSRIPNDQAIFPLVVYGLVMKLVLGIY